MMLIIFFTVILITSCAAMSDKCKKDLAKCTGSTSFNGLPTSMQQVNELCIAFKGGMSCIDEVKKQCITPEKKKVLDKQTADTELFIKLLCDDSGFQGEYLSHSECFTAVSNDWVYCTNALQNTVNEVMQMKSTYLQTLVDVCCARYGFNLCVSRASRAKCNRSGAIFLRRISELLSRDSACKIINVKICGSSASHEAGFIVVLSFVVLHIALSWIQN